MNQRRKPRHSGAKARISCASGGAAESRALSKRFMARMGCFWTWARWQLIFYLPAAEAALETVPAVLIPSIFIAAIRCSTVSRLAPVSVQAST